MRGALRVCALLLAFVTLIGATVPASRNITLQAHEAFGAYARAIAIVEPFAVVNVAGVPLEGNAFTGQALFRRFSFGWQMIDLANGRFHQCELLGDGVPPALVAPLSVNAAAITDRNQYHDACPPARAFGPTSDDENAVRAVIHGTALQWFHDVEIADGFALISWAGGGGGPMVARKQAGRWSVYWGTGGMPDACSLIRFAQVPPATARRLMVDFVGAVGASRTFTRIDNCPV
jgi:hypothetical protein